MDRQLDRLRQTSAATTRRSRRRIPAALGVATVVLALVAPVANADADDLGAAVREALGVDADTHYFESLVDLNADGRPEAVVYAAGPMVCGTGGCPLLVFRRHGNGYGLVSRTSVVHTPVLLSPPRHHGWHSLVVTVRGGGAAPARMELRFDGKAYPHNASVPPARPAGSLDGMETLIPEFASYKDGKPVPRRTR